MTAAFILIFVCVALLAFIFLALLIKRELDLSALRGRVVALRDRVTDYERRLGLIELHAIDYMHSIGAESTRALYEIRTTIEDAKRLVEEIESLLATRDFGAFEEARSLLDNRFPPEEPGYHGPRRYPKIAEWEERIEELLQRVGYDVSVASARRKATGIQRRDGARNTLSSLLDAGIRAVSQSYRMRDAPVRTLLKKKSGIR